MSNTNHGRPSGAALAFSDPELAAPSHADRARTLIAEHKLGSLATLTIEPAGYPYASMITLALDAGLPVFLISRLAEHTRNLLADSRASLLVHESTQTDPLANARVTLLGRVSKLDEAASARAAFLGAHPQSAYYADFDDFAFFRMQLEAVRYIGGYGRMSWVTADDFRRAQPDPLSSAASGILAHMNADHRRALLLYAQAFTSARDATEATMTAIDRLGFEMTVNTPRGVGPARITFDAPLTSSEQARASLVKLVRAAEAKLAAETRG
jgi:putative heme iron utilization protein